MKIKALIVAAIMGLLTTAANAGVSAGVSLTGYSLNADGSETHGSAQKRSESLEMALGSVFAEYKTAWGDFDLSLGIDHIPYDVDTETVSNYQINVTNNNQAKATISDAYKYYIMVGMGDSPVFVKFAYSEADVQTEETISNMQTDGSITRTNSTYPDATLKGTHFGLGANIDTGFGITVRAEFGLSDYDEMSVTSSSGGNTVKVDADGEYASLSLVKSF